MHGHLALLLHAHLPYVRHPEHERFLEESWFYEAVVESYLPLLQMLEGWHRDDLPATLTLTLSPTLCSMLQDPLLCDRCTARLDGLVQLAEAELNRTHLDPRLHALATFYHDRFTTLRSHWRAIGRDLVRAFSRLQQLNRIEIVTCAATHALLPLLATHSAALRAQIFTACEHYRECFGCDPRGIWLSECAYVVELEPLLKEAGLRWFTLESHGLLHATPQPRYATYAPILTPHGLAAFARDLESARQVWSRTEGYPGDPRYRDFYRDIGYDLDLAYIEPWLPCPGERGFTGMKYHRITGAVGRKELYDRAAAMDAVGAHAAHFLDARIRQVHHLENILGKPPVILMPYDAELFGHWWFEGVEFLDQFARDACRHRHDLNFVTPGGYLLANPTHQLVAPADSSWGEHGYFEVWLNESNDWILPLLRSAQERMSTLARQFDNGAPLARRALNQAARELMLAQASDWPFILRTGTSSEYARRRVQEHLARFNALHDQLLHGTVDEERLQQWEVADNIFPRIQPRHFA
jgi:1,4-alpha-glucan branching enzyme